MISTITNQFLSKPVDRTCFKCLKHCNDRRSFISAIEEAKTMPSINRSGEWIKYSYQPTTARPAFQLDLSWLPPFEKGYTDYVIGTSTFLSILVVIVIILVWMRKRRSDRRWLHLMRQQIIHNVERRQQQDRQRQTMYPTSPPKYEDAINETIVNPPPPYDDL